jgi:hypothetical protein
MEHEYFWMFLVRERLREARAEAAENARAQAARAALGSRPRVHDCSSTLLGRALVRVRDWLVAHAHPGLEKMDSPGVTPGRLEEGR